MRGAASDVGDALFFIVVVCEERLALVDAGAVVASRAASAPGNGPVRRFPSSPSASVYSPVMMLPVEP